MDTDEVLVRLRACGHRHIRATHDATIELATDGDITARATCVIGVGTEVIAGSPSPLAGTLQVTLEAGELSQSFTALANPWLKTSDGGLVFRRSDARLDDTLATAADLTAADLDRAFIDGLRDPSTELVVTIRRGRSTAGRAQLILGRVRAQGAKGGRKAAVLAAELAAADVVLSDDRHAKRFATTDAVDEGHETLLDGGRVLVVGTDELIGRSIEALLEGVDAPHLEAFGMPATIAAAAFVGGGRAITLIPPLRAAAEENAALAAIAGGGRVVVSASVARAERLLELVADRAAVAVAVIAPDTASESVARGDPGQLQAALETARGDVVLAMAASVEPAAAVPFGLVDALLTERGVAPSVVAAALADQPGWTRNQAYDAVVRRGEA